MNSLPGNTSSKSLIWVIIYDLSLSDSFNLIDPFETQNEWINLFTQSFLHFRQSILQYLHKLSFIYTGDLMPVEDKSIPFKFFLTFQTLFAPFRLENSTMTLFGPLLGNQWQSSILESISTASFLNNWRTVSFSSEFSIDSGRPLSSKHSRVEYWQLLQHCRSNETNCSLSFELTCLKTLSSDCTFS